MNYTGFVEKVIGAFILRTFIHEFEKKFVLFYYILENSNTKHIIDSKK